LYEHATHQVLSAHRFALRVLLNVLISFLIITVSLIVGIWGYEHFEGVRLRRCSRGSTRCIPVWCSL
jgi:hypothetical protein